MKNLKPIWNVMMVLLIGAMLATMLPAPSLMFGSICKIEPAGENNGN